MPLRLLISIPIVCVVFAFNVLTLPAQLLLALLVSWFTRYRTCVRAVCFIQGFFFLEILAILRLSWVSARYHDPAARLRAFYLVQYWWGQSLCRMGTWLYNLTFEVSGREAVRGPSAIVISRHASLGDNVLPLVFFGIARDEPLRYILKKELMWLPSLGWGGNVLPNLFVDRSGVNTSTELDAVARLVTDTTEHESVLIYPEGTRFSRAKQAALLDKADLAEQVERWPDLLPPRMGGVVRMLQVNPGKDVVFLCHTGFEPSASVPDLANGGWLGQTIRLHFWRVPYADIPEDHAAFLFSQWDHMQATVVAMKAQG